MKPASIEEVVAAIVPLMRGFKGDWCVAGGWAIDLYLGRCTRAHQDLELAIFRQDQFSLRRHLHDWKFEKVVDGQRTTWAPNEELKLPIHEIHGHSTKPPLLSLEFLLNERIGDEWVYRRDMRLRMPLSQAIVRGASNLPILSPAIVLLFKSKNRRTRDDEDFEAARQSMNREQLRWFEASLRPSHPAHPWLTRLNDRSQTVQDRY